MSMMYLLPMRCESGNVLRGGIGFYDEPRHTWMLPNWSPDRAQNVRAYLLLEATFPKWAVEMLRAQEQKP